MAFFRSAALPSSDMQPSPPLSFVALLLPHHDSLLLLPLLRQSRTENRKEGEEERTEIREEAPPHAPLCRRRVLLYLCRCCFITSEKQQRKKQEKDEHIYILTVSTSLLAAFDFDSIHRFFFDEESCSLSFIPATSLSIASLYASS